MATCLKPLNIKVGNKQNGFRETYHYVQVPCGKCPNCLKNRQQDWSFRIQCEADTTLRNGGSCYFVTITYDEDNLPLTDVGSTLVPADLSGYIKRVRRALDYKYSTPDHRAELRFFGCGEYGDSFDRPHYHVQMFLNIAITAEELRPLLESCWTYGLTLGVHPFDVRLSEYIAKYSTKRFGEDCSGKCPPFARMSLRPAIGADWIEKNKDFYSRNKMFHTYNHSGTPYRLPRFLRDKIHTLKDVNDHSHMLQYDNFVKEDSLSQFYPDYYIEKFRAEEYYCNHFFEQLVLKNGKR